MINADSPRHLSEEEINGLNLLHSHETLQQELLSILAFAIIDTGPDGTILTEQPDLENNLARLVKVVIDSQPGPSTNSLERIRKIADLVSDADQEAQPITIHDQVSGFTREKHRARLDNGLEIVNLELKYIGTLILSGLGSYYLNMAGVSKEASTLLNIATVGGLLWLYFMQTIVPQFSSLSQQNRILKAQENSAKELLNEDTPLIDYLTKVLELSDQLQLFSYQT